MLTYHHGDATAFLHSVSGHETIHDGLLLCDDHARRFSAPRGWMTVDRRRAMDTDPLGQVGQ
jgi:hypothetical protein